MVPEKINKLVHQPTSMGCFLEGLVLLAWGMLADFYNLPSNQKLSNRINRISECVSNAFGKYIFCDQLNLNRLCKMPEDLVLLMYVLCIYMYVNAFP